MKQRGFSSIILLLGAGVLITFGLIGFQSFKKTWSDVVEGLVQGKYPPDILPTPTFITEYERAMSSTVESRKEDDVRRKVDLSQIRNAIEQYAVDNEGVYPSRLELLIPTYLPELPKDPASRLDYIYNFTPPDTYSISTTLSDGTEYIQTNP